MQSAKIFCFSCKMSPTGCTMPASAVFSKLFPATQFPHGGQLELRKPGVVAFHAQVVQFPQRPVFTQARQHAVLCAAALNARCAAEQTQTVTRQSSTITIAPIQGKEKSPELDDGGTGLPPRDDGGGGGGGGGGGPNWSGGFFFFGLLALLGLFQDIEREDGRSSRNDRQRYSY